MKTARNRVAVAIALPFALALFAAPPASAVPRVGTLAARPAIADADGRLLEMKRLGARPILILYEDKNSSSMNQALKNDLARLAKGDRYQATVALIPVADVSAYDYWPVRGFVKDAIRDQSKQVGATIYCDWSGAFRDALSLRRGTSSVVLVARDGTVLFARDGALGAPERKELLDLLRAQVES